MALKSRHNECNEIETIVLENEREFIVRSSPYQIIKESCIHYGTTISASVEFAKTVLKDNRMLPVTISSIKEIYFIPTKAYKNTDCVWFSQKHIIDVHDVTNNTCEVLLSNGKTIPVTLHRNRMMMKIQRCALLRFVIQERNKMTNTFPKCAIPFLQQMRCSTTSDTVCPLFFQQEPICKQRKEPIEKREFCG